jgi:hypothetical protein
VSKLTATSDAHRRHAASLYRAAARLTLLSVTPATVTTHQWTAVDDSQQVNGKVPEPDRILTWLRDEQVRPADGFMTRLRDPRLDDVTECSLVITAKGPEGIMADRRGRRSVAEPRWGYSAADDLVAHHPSEAVTGCQGFGQSATLRGRAGDALPVS